jgi:pyridoxal biosynthesis lyase PdxS
MKSAVVYVGGAFTMRATALQVPQCLKCGVIAAATNRSRSSASGIVGATASLMLSHLVSLRRDTGSVARQSAVSALNLSETESV